MDRKHNLQDPALKRAFPSTRLCVLVGTVVCGCECVCVCVHVHVWPVGCSEEVAVLLLIVVFLSSPFPFLSP